MNIQVKPTALPSTREELLARKTMRAGPNLNDDIDRIHVILWDNPIYRRFHDGVFDEDTVEGSKVADDFEAATLIREFAAKPEHPEFNYIATKNKTTVMRSMKVVVKRYHMSRLERAQTVSGEVVTGNGNIGE